MAVRVGEKSETVGRCVPRLDGGYMIVTLKGASGSSVQPMEEGSRVLIRDGIARRPEQ